MIRVRFYKPDGDFDREVEAAPGDRLLDVAQEANQPLEGTCEGQMACSTCHIYLMAVEGEAPPPPSEEEEDLLDFAYGAARQSRLACQITLTEQMEALDVRMPGGSVDVSAG